LTTKQKIRRRELVLRDDSTFARAIHWTGPNLYLHRGRSVVRGKQVTASEGHPWSYNSKFKGADVGGPFRTEKIYVDDHRDFHPNKSPMWYLDGVYDSNRYIYHGPIYVDLPSSLPDPPVIESSDDALGALGTTAIARCKPTSSAADLSTAMGELFREGLPSMIGKSTWETRARDVRSAGNEYLNYVFGWAPLVSEVTDVAKGVSKANKLLKQYERDAGRLVRRSYEFPTIRETDPRVLVRSLTYPYFPGLAPKGGLATPEINAWQRIPGGLSAPMYSETTRVVKRYFKGAFTYYLPSDYESRNKVEEAAFYLDKILGLQLTPEVLWNLTPWSWAADWVGNFGDVLANVSDYATDGLVLRYGYMMEHSISKVTYTIPDIPALGGRTLTQTHFREVKKRVPATPFGFGLTFDSFSTKQKAILAALGITKVR
jgi:hypothetical protein